MTTNVYDISKTIIATDSRWSVFYGNKLIYIDDSGFEKIEIVHDFAVMFAGVASRIQDWKDFLRSNPTSMAGHPPHVGMSIAIVDCSNQSVLSAVNQKYTAPCGSCFAGSGAKYAYEHWTNGVDAMQAVENAKQSDCQTGGTVKFFDTKTRLTNVTLVSTVTASNMYQPGGLKVMELTKEGSPPFVKKELAAANDDALLNEIASKLATGEVSMSAPFEGMDQDWSDDDKDRLAHALARVFHWK